jgi:hypothetical protein
MRPGNGIRATALRRGKGLEPGPGPARKTRLRSVSPRRAEAPEPKSAARRETGPDRKTRKLVLERDSHACVCCGVSVEGRPYSLQHRKRRSQGGGNSPSNLITVLGTGTTGCHERIDSRRDPHDEAKGYTVRSWQDPAEVGVMVFAGPDGSGVTYWLTDDGQRTTEAPEGIEAA